jgi:hypothetical protein
MILNVPWAFVWDLNALNVEVQRIAPMAGLVITTYALKDVRDRRNALLTNLSAHVHLDIALSVQAHLIVLKAMDVIISSVYGLAVMGTMLYVHWALIAGQMNVLLDVQIIITALMEAHIAVRQQEVVKNV